MRSAKWWSKNGMGGLDVPAEFIEKIQREAIEACAMEAEATGRWGSYGDLSANIRSIKPVDEEAR